MSGSIVTGATVADWRPEFCQFVNGACAADLSNLQYSYALFLYPSNPPAIAATIESAAIILRTRLPGKVLTWRDLRV